jgi:hypothetical protein
VAAVALSCVERRGDRGTKKVVASPRVPAAQDVTAGYHEGTRDTPVFASSTVCSSASTMGRCGSDRGDLRALREMQERASAASASFGTRFRGPAGRRERWGGGAIAQEAAVTRRSVGHARSRGPVGR